MYQQNKLALSVTLTGIYIRLDLRLRDTAGLDKGAVLGADSLCRPAFVRRNIPDLSVFPHCSQLNTPRLCKEMLTLKKR